MYVSIYMYNPAPQAGHSQLSILKPGRKWPSDIYTYTCMDILVTGCDSVVQGAYSVHRIGKQCTKLQAKN